MFARLPGRLALVALLVTLATLLPAFPGQRAHAQTCTTTVRDTKQGIVACMPLHAGLVIVRARHNGTSNFAASLLTQDPNGQPLAQNPNAYKDAYLIFDQVGRFDGAAAAVLRTDGPYYLQVGYASGPYEFIFEQPTPASVTPVNQTSFTGRGQQVTPVFNWPAGTVTVTAQTDASALLVWLYAIDDLGGGAVSTNYDGRIIDTGRGTGTTVSVDIPSNGLYLLAVDTLSAPTTSWTLTLR